MPSLCAMPLDVLGSLIASTGHQHLRWCSILKKSVRAAEDTFSYSWNIQKAIKGLSLCIGPWTNVWASSLSGQLGGLVTLPPHRGGLSGEGRQYIQLR